MNEIEVKQKFAKKLKELREERGLTQKDLANVLKVSRGSVSFYENADRMAGIDFIYKAAKYFDCSTDYLLGLEEFINAEYKNSFNDALRNLSDRLLDISDHTKADMLNILDEIIEGYISAEDNFLKNRYVETLSFIINIYSESAKYPKTPLLLAGGQDEDYIYMLWSLLLDQQSVAMDALGDYFSLVKKMFNENLPPGSEMKPTRRIADLLNTFKKTPQIEKEGDPDAPKN